MALPPELGAEGAGKNAHLPLFLPAALPVAVLKVQLLINTFLGAHCFLYQSPKQKASLQLLGHTLSEGESI